MLLYTFSESSSAHYCKSGVFPLTSMVLLKTTVGINGSSTCLTGSFTDVRRRAQVSSTTQFIQNPLVQRSQDTVCSRWIDGMDALQFHRKGLIFTYNSVVAVECFVHSMCPITTSIAVHILCVSCGTRPDLLLGNIFSDGKCIWFRFCYAYLY